MTDISENPPHHIIAATDNGLCRITIKRPDIGNGLNYPTIIKLADKIETASADQSVRAIMIEGAGEHFCMGDMSGEMGAWPERFRHRCSGGQHGAAPIIEQHMLRAVRAAPKHARFYLAQEGPRGPPRERF